jgi:hypothetical protein
MQTVAINSANTVNSPTPIFQPAAAEADRERS